MTDRAPSPVLAEVWRGGVLEAAHRGIAVVARASGEIVEAWGDPARVILPRSSCKMLQALPLLESGAAEAARLGAEEIALACASHGGAAAHVDRIRAWLAALGAGSEALLCGAHAPNDRAARRALAASGARPETVHNNCSGKHAGFLTLARHLGAGPDYVDPGHPVQRAVRLAIAETTGEDPGGPAIDGCSAPNFAVSVGGLARAVARFADPSGEAPKRRDAMTRARDAMAAHPVLIGHEASYATRLTRAASGRAVVKTGAEGSATAILPGRGLGIAVKIEDGAERAAEAAVAALLLRHGAIDRADPAYRACADAPILNWRGFDCGRLIAAPRLLA